MTQFLPNSKGLWRGWPPIAILMVSLLTGNCLTSSSGTPPLTAPIKGENEGLRIIHFNLGQADATLVLYRGKSLLIDCGSPMHEPKRASRTIPKHLDTLLGKRSIDYFVPTHYHQDHIGAPGRRGDPRRSSGIFSLIERDGIRIHTLLDRGLWSLGPATASQKHYHRTIQHWLAEGRVGSRRALVPGATIPLGEDLEVRVVVVGANGVLDQLQSVAPEFVRQNAPSENDYSVGVKITLGDFDYFVAGDLSGQNVVRRYGPVTQSYTDLESWIAADVGELEIYRVNHHGSRYSSNPCFVDRVRPQVSIISSGHDNPYGHPHPQVYQRLRHHGDVYITDGVALSTRAALDPSALNTSIVGTHIDVRVTPNGERFWLNGRPYTSRKTRIKNPTACRQGLLTQAFTATYHQEELKH